MPVSFEFIPLYNLFSAYQWLAETIHVNIVIALLCIATHAHKFYPCYDYDMTHAVSLTHIHSDDPHQDIRVINLFLAFIGQWVQTTLHSGDSQQGVVGINLFYALIKQCY